jgi:hypothetical protein
VSRLKKQEPNSFLLVERHYGIIIISVLDDYYATKNPITMIVPYHDNLKTSNNTDARGTIKIISAFIIADFFLRYQILIFDF